MDECITEASGYIFHKYLPICTPLEIGIFQTIDFKGEGYVRIEAYCICDI